MITMSCIFACLLYVYVYVMLQLYMINDTLGVSEEVIESHYSYYSMYC